MTLDKCAYTGAIKISGIVGGYLETRTYMGYLLCEAIYQWQMEFNT
jgi:hypothetical protein